MPGLDARALLLILAPNARLGVLWNATAPTVTMPTTAATAPNFGEVARLLGTVQNYFAVSWSG
jgi:hypothetical protein